MKSNQASFTDQQIVNTIQKGKQKECNEVVRYLYKSHYPKINRYIIKNSGTDIEAQDVFQETLLIFYNQVEDGKFLGKSSISTYIFTIARNFWISEIRKRKGAIYVEVPENESIDEQTIEALLVERSSIKLFNRLFELLGDGCKKILAYAYFDELSVKEMQQKLALGSDQAVRTKKFRCLQKLTEIFKENKITRDQFTI